MPKNVTKYFTALLNPVISAIWASTKTSLQGSYRVVFIVVFNQQIQLQYFKKESDIVEVRFFKHRYQTLTSKALSINDGNKNTYS